jgi:hypothetical protein
LSRVTSTKPDDSQLNWPQLYLGVSFTTLATLILELSLTRIFSVVFYYHFAFLAISIALFGLGAGGVMSYWVAARPGPLFSKLGKLAVANAFAVVLAAAFLLNGTRDTTALTLALVYLVSAVPFCLAGIVVSLAVSESISRVDRVYFFDLMGAAGGCLLLVPLLDSIGGPNTVIAAGILYAASAAIWFNIAKSSSRRAMAVFVGLGLLGLIFFNARSHWIDVHYAKGEPLPDEIYSKWNSFSRIGVAPEKGSDRMQIIIDADAATGIANFDFDHLDDKMRTQLTHEGPGFVYTLRPGAKTLIIGPGGGWDVARALASGSKDITGVEINPIIAHTVMMERFPQLSNRLYFRPEVKIDVEDGRSFVRRSPDKYQVLEATLVDTWASTAAGAFALTENNLYTSDAFYDYLSHLTDDGVMSFTRWGFDPPRESLRLLTLAMNALGRLDEKDFAQHVIVLRADEQKIKGWGAQDTVLISRKPFTADDVAKAKHELEGRSLKAVYLPGDPPKNPFGEILQTKDLKAFERDYPFDISSVSDDRPFFFYTVQPRDLWSFLMKRNTEGGAADYKINRAVPLLYGLLAVSLVATLVILLLPRLMLGSQLPKDTRTVLFLLYFAAIGVGYILIQVALIQRFVLFLGHPTYALWVIIFSMLVASGIGSYWSRRWITNLASWQYTLIGIFALVVIMAFVTAPVTRSLVGLALGVKILITVVGIAPLAFFMGMPFPAGLSLIEKLNQESVRWAWALNASSSVLGSASAIFIAIYAGLKVTMIAGGLCYLLALAARRSAKTA